MPYFKDDKLYFYYRASLSFLVLIAIITSTPVFSQDFDDQYEQVKSELRLTKEYFITRDSIYLNGNELAKGCLLLIESKNKLKDKLYNESDSLLKLAKSHFEIYKCSKGVGFCEFYFGNIASSRNDLEGIIVGYTNSLDYFKTCGYYDGVVLSYFKLATYFSRNHNELEAKKYFSRGEKYIVRTDNERIKISYYLNYAAYLTELTEADSALVFYDYILTTFEDKLNDDRKARVYNNLAANYIVLGEWNNALKFLNRSFELKAQLNDTIGLMRTSQNLFKYHVQLQHVDKAREFHKQLTQFFKNDTSDYGTYVDFLHNELQYYLLLNEADSVSKLLPLYRNASIKYENSAFSDKLIEMQKGFELKEKDREIALLEKEDALNQAHLKTKNILIAVAVGFVVVLLIVAYLINRQRRELVQSRKRLLRQKEDITGMNEQLRVSNLAKDRILSVIGHDLRGPVGGLKELIELYMELPEYEPNDVENLLKAARESSTSTYHLLENLLSWANSQRGDIEFKPMATPLAPLIKHSVKLLDKSINTRRIKFTFDIPETLVVQVDMNMLRTIIRNLVSNAIKYSPEHGEVRIKACPKDNNIHLCISDNGSGMTGEEAQSIFHKKETYFIGSEFSAKGTGLGLILCKEFVERHEGRIWIESQKGAGTTVCFSLPHSQKIGQNIVTENAFSN